MVGCTCNCNDARQGSLSFLFCKLLVGRVFPPGTPRQHAGLQVGPMPVPSASLMYAWYRFCEPWVLTENLFNRTNV